MSKVDDKRTAILQATLSLISEHGFHGTAMSKVAKEEGVSAGIIYHYFKNKDQLIVELYIDCKVRLFSDLQKQHDTSAPLRSQIRTMWDTMIRQLLRHPQETLFMNQFCTSPYYTKEVEEAVAPYFASVHKCFEEGIKEMIIKPLPQQIYGTLIMDVPSALVRREAAGQIELTENLIDEVVEALWQAIRM